MLGGMSGICCELRWWSQKVIKPPRGKKREIRSRSFFKGQYKRRVVVSGREFGKSQRSPLRTLRGSRSCRRPHGLCRVPWPLPWARVQ